MKQKKKTRKRKFFSLLPLIFCVLIFLTGCVHYDVGVNFKHQHHGAIVQHIKLGEQLTNLSQSEAQKWLTSIEERARQLQGKTQEISQQEIVVTIPFSNGKELALKFNKFFNPNPQKASQSAKVDALDLVQLNSEMSLRQSNLLLLERNRLSLSVDLRALGVLSNQGNLIVSPGSLIDLEFALKTPWGARSIVGENSLSPEVRNGERQLVWQLQPGQINYIEAVFWVPSPLGLGTIVIVLLMLAGFYIKYKRFPWVVPESIQR
ncbi:MAG: DUF3153 domain-containing protein [Xenococcaceae cyanobacterium]